MLRRVLAAGALTFLAFVWTAWPATATSDVTCPPGQLFCVVQVTTPPQSTTPAAGAGQVASGGGRVCTVPNTGEQTPCHVDSWGWWDDGSSCYWLLLSPQPPDSVVWEGHHPDGAVYSVVCLPFYPNSTNGGWVWRASPPPGYGATAVTTAQLAQQAVDKMALTGPVIGLSIPADKFATVGVPVWLWTTVTPTTWGPNSATAAVPGLSVTATAQARQIVWDTGDRRTETCRNPGTPYYTGGLTSPTCQHIYDRSSADQPDLAYRLTATTTWDVTWTGGGTSGSMTVTRVSTGSVRVGEVQVLITTG
ncbi:MAG TPA: hypothetical protein VGK17_15070 [Propionicimonas sp.]